MIPTTNFDLPSLHLLLPEIEVILTDAEMHLNEFYDDHEQAPLLLDSIVVMNQLTQVLDLISLKGASNLAKALTHCLKKLHDQGNADDINLIMDISEGIMVLDRYIEFVLLKEVLEPSLLLPIINKLLAHLGRAPLVADNLNSYSSIHITSPAAHYKSPAELGMDAVSLSTNFRAGLAKALDVETPQETLDPTIAKMHEVCVKISDQSNMLFWQAAAIATSNLNALLPLSNANKLILIYIEQQLNNYLSVQDKRFADLVGLACQRDERFAKTVFGVFSANTQNQNEHEQMRRFLFGPNRQITDTLNIIIQNEIVAIKDHVDALVRHDNSNINSKVIAEQLITLSKTMQLLNLDDAAGSLKRAAEEVNAWQTPTPEDFDTLLGELMVAENAAIFLAKTHTPGAITLPLQNRHISLHQLDTAYDTLIKESRTNIATVSQAVSDYLADPRRELMHLEHVDDMLRQAAGAAKFLKLTGTANLLTRLARYFEETIASGQKPSEEQLYDVADVVMTADYYFEGYEHNRPLGRQALLIGQHSLNRLIAT